VFFDVDKTYTIAERKFLLCNDEDIHLGAKVKVKSTGKTYLGSILNIGE